MEYIPPGTFLMGCYPGETGCFMSLAHPVTLTRGFCMDRTEVTQRQYKKSAGFNAAFFRRCGPECPVENVSWEQAYRYCARVGKRLPTEAEWEYAARAGMWDVFWWGHEPDGAYLWYRDNSFVKYKTGCSWCGGRGTHPVATKRSNPWGLHDMCGNVSEWVVDMYDRHWYQRSPDKDPVNTEPYIVASFSYRVSRGGNWSIDDHFVFISYRSYAAQDDSSPAIGFRCARDKLAP
jgi:formylglycine-generating enzyme required for sulfatase activity